MFLDYVHPTKMANLLVAESAFGMMISNGVLKDPPTKNQFTYHDRPYQTNGEPYRDENDVDLQMAALRMAIENHQYERAIRVTEAAFQHRTGHRLSGPNDPVLMGDTSETAQCYRAFYNYLEAERRVILSEPGSDAGLEEANRQVQAYYDKWYPLGRF
jgi:hypothetical protein